MGFLRGNGWLFGSRSARHMGCLRLLQSRTRASFNSKTNKRARRSSRVPANSF